MDTGEVLVLNHGTRRTDNVTGGSGTRTACMLAYTMLAYTRPDLDRTRCAYPTVAKAGG